MVEVFKQRGYDVVSNGTENHLFLVSFIKQGLTGKAADAALGKRISPLIKTPYQMIHKNHL